MRLFTLEKRRFRWDLISVYKYLMGRNAEEGGRLLSVVLWDRRRGNEHKLKHTNPMWTQGNSSVRILRHWFDRLFREALESSSEEILKSQLGNLSGDTAWAEGLQQVNSRCHLQTKQFCDSATFSLQQLTSSLNYIQLKECWRTELEQRFVSGRISSVSLPSFSQLHYLRLTVLHLVEGFFKKVVTNANS